MLSFECDAGFYASLPYALAQGDVELPYIIVQTVIWALITYFMMGFEVQAGEDLSLAGYYGRTDAVCSQASIPEHWQCQIKSLDMSSDRANVSHKPLKHASRAEQLVNSVLSVVCRQILLVSAVHAADTIVLYLLWAHGGGAEPKLADFLGGLYNVLCHMEHLLRLLDHHTPNTGALL